MSSRNKDERAHVNALVKAIQENSPAVYVYIDRDAGSVRHTCSGFDFILAYKGCAVFCEAKMQKGRLTSWQQFVQAQIIASGTKYHVVRFSEDGEYFFIGDKKSVAIKDATIEDFL